MHQNMVNDLAEAMKALDGKKSILSLFGVCAYENTAFFFSVQRLHGFRQVVTNVQPQQTS